MSKHLLDYALNVSKQTFSAAVIVDSKGKQQGRIVIRFTDAQIGYNHQVGVIFWPAEVSAKDTRKGNTYNQPGTLFCILRDMGAVVFSYDKRMIDYDDQKAGAEGHNYDSFSRFEDITSFKYKGKTYRVLWAL